MIVYAQLDWRGRIGDRIRKLMPGIALTPADIAQLPDEIIQHAIAGGLLDQYVEDFVTRFVDYVLRDVEYWESRGGYRPPKPIRAQLEPVLSGLEDVALESLAEWEDLFSPEVFDYLVESLPRLIIDAVAEAVREGVLDNLILAVLSGELM